MERGRASEERATAVALGTHAPARRPGSPGSRRQERLKEELRQIKAQVDAGRAYEVGPVLRDIQAQQEAQGIR